MITTNWALSKLLGEMEERLKAIKTSPDILEIVQIAISYPDKIEYNQRDCQLGFILGCIAQAIYFMILQRYYDVGGEFFILLLLSFIFSMLITLPAFLSGSGGKYILINITIIIFGGGSVGLLLYGATQHFYPSVPIFYHVVSVFASVLILFPLGVMRHRKCRIRDLSYELFDADSLLDNNIQPFVSRESFSEELLFSSFSEFRRGNYSREFRQFLKISQDTRPEAIYYHFHYVDRRVEKTTSRDSDGRVRTETEIVYNHYDRYGIIFDFLYGQGLSLNSSGDTHNKVNYKPSYTLFNKKFEIGANSEIDAAKMLKPALQVELFEMTKKIPDINIQISNNNQLLIGTHENMFSRTKPNYTLKDPQAFYNELLEINKIDYIEKAYQIYNILTTHLDNNFS